MNLSFQSSTYSASNKPSTATLKTDIQTIETEHNAHVADATIHFLASAMWPVGSVYTAVVATNPATLLGFGTWSAFAAGKVLVGIDAGQTEFDTVEETGGAKTNTVGIDASGVRTSYYGGVAGNSGSAPGADYLQASHDHPDLSISTLQPYVVVYMWKRTA